MTALSSGRQRALGHLFAFTTCLIWGFTFVASKVLLNAGLTPFETLLIRFAIAYLALWVFRPRWLGFLGWRRELPLILCGIFGVTLYYLLEYHSLQQTSANYTGIITGTAPLMVALAMWAFYRERPRKLFVLGFGVAICGIALVTLGGGDGLDISLLAAVLAFGGTLAWAAYCVTVRRIDQGIEPILAIRRAFFWALASTVPCSLVFGFDVGLSQLLVPEVLVALLLLAVVASALCYLMYNMAITWIGAVKTSAYIYFTPAVNAIGAFFVLGEQIMPLGILGIVVIIVGLIVSELG
jgi:drug/metabolite transporter (DMT)-like permease